MEKRLIARGLLAGGVAAVLAFVFARLFAEPVIGRAIAFEDSRATEHGTELFSRGVQSNAGLGFGVLIFGVAMGALFAVLFCVVYGRATRTANNTAPRELSLSLAAGAFGALYLVPFVKYPPNPPAVGHADTIGMRTGWYLVMVLASLVLAVAAVLSARQLTARLGAWNGWLLAALGYVAAVAAVMVVLPTVDEIPPGFPADDLYEFRLLALGTQLLLWATIGLVFAALAGRLLGERAESLA